MPTVSAMAELAQTVDGADLRPLGGDLFHPAVGLLVLLAIAVLNVYKPTGVTPYGWRKQREQRNGLQRNTHRATSLVSPTGYWRRCAATLEVQRGRGRGGLLHARFRRNVRRDDARHDGFRSHQTWSHCTGLHGAARRQLHRFPGLDGGIHGRPYGGVDARSPLQLAKRCRDERGKCCCRSRAFSWCAAWKSMELPSS